MNIIQTLSTYFADDQRRNILHILLIVCCVIQGFLLVRRRRKNSVDGETQAQWYRHPLLFVGLALAVGSFMRIYGLDFGLPNAYHPDELQKAHLLRKMMAKGDLAPSLALHPPLLLYMALVASKLLAFFGYFADDTISRILLGGRLANAVCGILSIYLVYEIGKRVSSAFTGALAALILAVLPLHITCSRYMKEDAVFLMFVLVSVLLVLKTIEEKKVHNLYLAALYAGIALGSKLTAILVLVAIPGAAWLVPAANGCFSFVPNTRLLKHSIIALIVCVPIGFFITIPYLFDNADRIVQLYYGFRAESRHALNGHLGLRITPWSQYWMYHFSRSLIPGMNLLPVLAALFGTGMLLSDWKPRGLFIIALALLFYLPAEMALSKPPPQPDRYVLACAPFLAILAAEFIRRTRALLPETGPFARSYLTPALCTALLVFPLTRSVLLASELRNDTRRQMTEWLANNISEGQKILLAGGSTYLCRIPQKLAGISIRKALPDHDENLIQELKESKYKYLLTSQLTDPRFKVQGVSKKGNSEEMEQIKQNFRLIHQVTPKWGSYGFHNPVLSLYALKESPVG